MHSESIEANVDILAMSVIDVLRIITMKPRKLSRTDMREYQSKSRSFLSMSEAKLYVN